MKVRFLKAYGLLAAGDESDVIDGVAVELVWRGVAEEIVRPAATEPGDNANQGGESPGSEEEQQSPVEQNKTIKPGQVKRKASRKNGVSNGQ